MALHEKCLLRWSNKETQNIVVTELMLQRMGFVNLYFAAVFLYIYNVHVFQSYPIP